MAASFYRTFTIHFLEEKISFEKKGIGKDFTQLNKENIKLEYNTSKVFHKLLNKARIENIFEKNDFECLGAILYKILSLSNSDKAYHYFYSELKVTVIDPENYRALIVLSFDKNASNYAMLPWEYMQIKESPISDIPTPFYLASHRKKLFDVVRYIPPNDKTVRKDTISTQGQLTIVQIICNPTDDPINVSSYQKCFEKLRNKFNTPQEKKITTLRIENINISQLHTELKENTKHIEGEYIIHFFGHAQMANHTSQIAFRNDDGTKQWISHQDFATYFTPDQPYKKPLMIVLQACESAQLNEHGAGLASSLIEQGIPYVLGMQNEVSVDVFMGFFSKFYNAVLEGKHLFEAVTDGRVYLGTAHGDKEPGIFSNHYNDNSFGTPVIFTSNTTPLYLFPKNAQKERIHKKLICTRCGTTYDYSATKQLCNTDGCTGRLELDRASIENTPASSSIAETASTNLPTNI